MTVVATAETAAARRSGLGTWLRKRAATLIVSCCCLLSGKSPCSSPASRNICCRRRRRCGPKFWKRHEIVIGGAWVTTQEILAGYVLAVVVSIPLALAVAYSRFMEKAVYPVIVFLQIIPKIAIAPLFIIWFGFGFTPKLLLVFLLSFFPIVVASIAGFKAADPEMMDFARTTGAGGLRMFLKIRLPQALPHIFTGLKVGAALAATAAVVAEFVASDEGSATCCCNTTASSTRRWCSPSSCCQLIGLAVYYAVEIVERIAIPWHVSQQVDRRDDHLNKKPRRNEMRFSSIVGALAVLAASSIVAKRDDGALRLNWYLGGLHVPFYYGKEKGFYAAEGIDLTINEGRGSANTVQVVAAGSDTFGLADSSGVVATAAKGAEVKSVMSLLNSTGFSVVSLAEPASRRRRISRARKSRYRPAIRSANCSARSLQATTSIWRRSRMVQVDPAAKVVTVLEKGVDALLGGADDQYFLIKYKGESRPRCATPIWGQHRRHDDPHAGSDHQEESRPRAALRARDGAIVGGGEEESGSRGRCRDEGEARPQSPVDARPAHGRYRAAGFEEFEGPHRLGRAGATGTRRSRS